MSKGNMLFSQARGKVGDLVFSRLDGEQIVRSRNRHPKNPKTNAQLFQRAIMATVLRAYSAGKMIFDHAFEGKQVGAQCQRYFLSENAKRLRAAIASDIENNVTSEDARGHVVAPGVAYPVPFEYIVSKGSLAPSALNVSYGLEKAKEGETIGDYAARVGLVNGELHTIVAFGSSYVGNIDNILFTVNGTTADGAKMTLGKFGFIRLVVDIKPDDLKTVITNATLMSKFFAIDASENLKIPGWDEQVYYDEHFYEQLTIGNGINVRTAGVIHSIENEGLRSDCTLQIMDNAQEWGISSPYALQAWQQGATALGDSELILEGGDI